MNLYSSGQYSSTHSMDHNLDQFAFYITFPLGLILITLFLTIASYLCTRMGLAAGNPSTHQTITIPNSDRNFASIELGLDEVSLQSFPKLLYSQYKLQKNSSTTASCCSICLMDYKETDVLQLLPDCGHLFHLKCINPWLRLHPTCPMCRNLAVSIPSVVRPPIQVPAAPLAAQQAE